MLRAGDYSCSALRNTWSLIHCLYTQAIEPFVTALDWVSRQSFSFILGQDIGRGTVFEIQVFCHRYIKGEAFVWLAASCIFANCTMLFRVEIEIFGSQMESIVYTY